MPFLLAERARYNYARSIRAVTGGLDHSSWRDVNMMGTAA